MAKGKKMYQVSFWDEQGFRQFSKLMEKEAAERYAASFPSWVRAKIDHKSSFTA